MHYEDKVTIWFIVTAAFLLFNAFFWSLSNNDVNEWNRQYNNCYVHHHVDRSLWHKDVTTDTLYCPTKALM